jgi:hypothetical protein
LKLRERERERERDREMVDDFQQEGSKPVNKQVKYYLAYKSEGMQCFISSSIVEERFSCCTFEIKQHAAVCT